MDNPIKHQDMLALAEYQRELYEKPQLHYLFFELTDKCNLNCLHCGSSCKSGNSTILLIEAVEKTLDSVAAAYDPAQILVCITGGEPFLHPDLTKIIAMAHEQGFLVGITTNGTLITKENAEAIVQAGLDSIAVSIDGIGPDHDVFRNGTGSFEHAARGIRYLKQAGIKPQIITVVHRNNISHLEQMFSYFQNLGIRSWRIVNVEPIGRAVENNLLLSGSELKRLLDFIREKRFDRNCDMHVTYGCSHFLGFDYEHELRDFYFQCGAGLQIASVMANGEIGACLDIERLPELIQGNIYKDDFVDVWENRFRVFRQDRVAGSSKCRNCESRSVCMGDSAHTWDFISNEPRYCVTEILKEVG